MKTYFSSTPYSNRLRPIFLLFGLCFSSITFAELEELDDQNLEELTGKEGITIDLSYKLSIGEIYIDYSDNADGTVTRFKGLTEPPPRIEYHHGKQ